MPMGGGMLIGTPDLEQTTNTEIDLGFENNYDGLNLKTKLFYSWLDDYIYYNSSKMMQRFENVDATIYGIDLSGSYQLTRDKLWYLDFGLAYQRGRKDAPLQGQTDRDLAEIPPLKANLSLNWDYTDNSSARLELIAADSWDRYDADNGEQELDSYAVMNFKVQHALTNTVELTAGVDNIFNETYAVSNTYKDLTLISTGADEVILMNEPGRYFYFNAAYRF